jgi:hypothetical protein
MRCPLTLTSCDLVSGHVDGVFVDVEVAVGRETLIDATPEK